MIMAGKSGYKAVISLNGVVLGKTENADATFNKTLAEASTRDGEGFRGKCPALKDIAISGNQLWVPTDAGLLLLLSAWFEDTRVEVVMTDEAAGYGWTFHAFVGTLGKGEPLDGVQTLSYNIESDGKITPLSQS